MKCERMDKFDYLIALATMDAKDDDVKMFMELDDSDVVFSDRITDKIEKLIRRESVYRTCNFVKFKRILSKRKKHLKRDAFYISLPLQVRWECSA